MDCWCCWEGIWVVTCVLGVANEVGIHRNSGNDCTRETLCSLLCRKRCFFHGRRERMSETKGSTREQKRCKMIVSTQTSLNRWLVFSVVCRNRQAAAKKQRSCYRGEFKTRTSFLITL